MKKRLAILLSFAMVLTFALAACGGGGGDVSDSKYVGTWVSDTMSLAGESGDFDNAITLVLNDDGTGTCVAVDEEGVEETTEFTWEPTDEGFKTKGDMKLKFTDDGEQIHAKMFGVSLNFEKQ